jgi:hypothetical protein
MMLIKERIKMRSSKDGTNTIEIETINYEGISLKVNGKCYFMDFNSTIKFLDFKVNISHMLH